MSLFRPAEQRSANWEALGASGFGRGDSLLGSGMRAALRLAPVYAATGMIADSLSILPLAAYEFTNGARQRMSPQPPLMYAPHPNPVFTRVEWLHQFATSYLLRGNAYGLVTAIEPSGTPSKVQWLHPDHVEVDESIPSAPRYSYMGRPLDISTVLHIPWYPVPGSIVGESPIGLFRRQLETGTAAEDFGRNWFRNGAAPAGHLKWTTGSMDDEKARRTRERFKASVAENDIFVSGNDWEWKQLSVTADEAQFLETIKATANTVAAIYRVDPEEIGGASGSSLTYTTLELNQIKFQTRTLQPIFTRLEAHLTRLLPEYTYAKFNADAVVRTDLKTRMDAYAVALDKGIYTNPEVRAREDLAPLTAAELADWAKQYGKQPQPQAVTGRNGDDHA